MNASHDGFATAYGPSLGAGRSLVRVVVLQTLSLVARAPRAPQWGGYLVWDRDLALVVGTCGFKHGPEANGSVEIAYFTFPDFEGQGYATAMARELLALATASASVREVLAHTLPERNASCQVLEKVGFQCTGDVDDPEDGRIWRWTYPLNQ